MSADLGRSRTPSATARDFRTSSTLRTSTWKHSSCDRRPSNDASHETGCTHPVGLYRADMDRPVARVDEKVRPTSVHLALNLGPARALWGKGRQVHRDAAIVRADVEVG